MIRYESGSFGFIVLFRIHGSAVFKSLTPTLVSSAIFVVLLFTTDIESENNTKPIFDHPYAMGALIAALTFLLAFRANFSYNRYWEAAADVHNMHSKWLDVAIQLAGFHLQWDYYNAHKPPSYGDNPQLTHLERERERTNEPTLAELEVQLDQMGSLRKSLQERVQSAIPLRWEKGVLRWRRRNKTTELPPKQKKKRKATKPDRVKTIQGKSINLTRAMKKKASLDSYLLPLSEREQLSSVQTLIKPWDPRVPPLFLQETAHLISLLSAVAMSTLRNDLEEADSPLIPFVPGSPWPHVDPDAYGADVRKEWTHSKHRSFTVLKYLCGISRTPGNRTLYNAARPFRVIGGVSDAEIELLQAARGPLAKVALCSMWISEFISREHLAGSTGRIAPPIISRLYQCLSDGMIGYNEARKVAYIPFPFPHAQITSLFVLVVVGFMPVLMLSYLNNIAFGFVLNFLTVMCFTGLHEVARELESPFQNVPNDLPLNNFQAQFNEALMTIFTGYHPDAYWEVKEDDVLDPSLLVEGALLQQGLDDIKDDSDCSDDSGMEEVMATPMSTRSSGRIVTRKQFSLSRSSPKSSPPTAIHQYLPPPSQFPSHNVRPPPPPPPPPSAGLQGAQQGSLRSVVDPESYDDFLKDVMATPGMASGRIVTRKQFSTSRPVGEPSPLVTSHHNSYVVPPPQPPQYPPPSPAPRSGHPPPPPPPPPAGGFQSLPAVQSRSLSSIDSYENDNSYDEET